MGLGLMGGLGIPRLCSFREGGKGKVRSTCRRARRYHGFGLCCTMSAVYSFLVVFMRWRSFGWIGFRRVPLLEMAVITEGLKGQFYRWTGRPLCG